MSRSGSDFDLPVDGGDQSRHLLPLLLFNVIAQRLEDRVVRILGQVRLACRAPALAKLSVRQLLARLGVGGVHGVVLGAHFVVETLVARAAFAIDRIRRLAVQLQHHAQLGQRAADVALLPGVHGGAWSCSFS